MRWGKSVIMASFVVVSITASVPPPPIQAAPDAPVEAVADPVPTSRYQPLQPCRLVDTRIGLGSNTIDPTTQRVALDACGVPEQATAVVITAAIVNATRTGWLVAYPTGSERPTAATLNWAPGATRGNSSTVAVGDDRSIDVHRSDGHFGGHLVIDVSGAFVATDTATAGRFVASSAQRLLDTRSASTDRPTAGSTVRIALPADIDDDARALAVTVTAIGTDQRSFVSASAAGAARPTTSILNADGPGQFRAASTIVEVSSDGFDLFVSSGMHLTVDMTGWFTGESAADSADGLFVAVVPDRLRDTRPEASPIHPGGSIEIPVTAATSEPVAAVVTSMTLIAGKDRGFVTSHAARTDRPTTASGYARRHEVTAQFAITAVSTTGISVYSEVGTDLTVDLLGWFTGPATPETTDEPATNDAGVQRVLAIGDSSMAGVRWYRALGALTGASWTFDGESCRRIVRYSCRGREGRTPPTTVQTLNAMPDTFDVLVMMTGYNDGAATFAADLDLVMAVARAKHIRRVVWLTYTPELATDKGAGVNPQIYAFHDAILRSAAERYPDLVVADWAAVARQRPDWFHADGLHFTNEGAFGNADFMSRAVAHATGQPCPIPSPAASTADAAVCPDPSSAPIPDVRSRYGIIDTNTQCWEVGPGRVLQCVPDPYA